MLTNKFNLPAPLVRAIRNDPYDGGDSEISVTRLIQPPQITKLSKGREIIEDASERIWALLGQAVHTILERANTGEAGVVVEKRIYREVLGWRVSGKFDVWEEGILSDYKITSVYAREGKIEWQNQLNLLRVLCHYHRIPIDRLQVVAIFRDWRPKEAFKDDYPQSQVAVIPVPLWPIERAEAYLEERVRLHQLDIPPPCTDEERWMVPSKWALMQGETDQWAVMKEGGKRAVKLLDEKPNESTLKPGQFIEHRPGAPGKHAIKLFDLKPTITLGKGQYLEYRPGEYRRCESYCAAAPFCDQWKTDEARRRDQDQPETECAPSL